jgi:arginyl-tRNA synthetase
MLLGLRLLSQFWLLCFCWDLEVCVSLGSDFQKFNKQIYLMGSMKDIVVKFVAGETGMRPEDVNLLIEVPPRDEMGDFAFPCFALAKEKKKSPVVIAKDLSQEFSKKLSKGILKVTSEGPYVNFFIDKEILAKNVLDRVGKKNFGKLKLSDKRVGIEYPSPNTNKQLHVGHLRNMAIGTAVSNIVEAVGNKVFRLNLFSDRGILISKSMVGYNKFAKGKTPASEGIKGDKFIGDLYIRFSKDSEGNPELEEEAKKILQLWEGKDKKTRDLWRKLNSWVYAGMSDTFDRFGLPKPVKTYFESDMYEKGRDIVEKGLNDGIFEKKDGAVVVDLEQEGLGEKVLLRSDGTSVYMTNDLFFAEQKLKDFNLDSSYYVVGCDQDYHFKVLFNILDKLGMKKDWRHLSYGMVSLPSGKMKSRLGTAISADKLIDETQEIAKAGIIDRSSEKLSKKELGDRSLKIALAAIKYNLLKVDIRRGIVFDSKDALAFEGDTGPYLLYSYARASSIVRKAKGADRMKISKLEDSEIRLIKKIDLFEQVLARASEELAPNLIANYCFELAKIFNEFYHACPVLGSDKSGFRLKLVDVFRVVLRRGLDLLGIEVVEEM